MTIIWSEKTGKCHTWLSSLKKPLKKHLQINLILAFFLTSSPQLSKSQQFANASDATAESFRAFVAEIYGPNEELINGRVYFPDFGQIDGHPYFATPEWTPGTVYIKGDAHPKLELNYNIESDELILQAQLDGEAFTKISLNKALVDSFNLQGHLFIHSDVIFPHDSLNRFYELIYNGEFTFLRQYDKEFKDQFTNLAPDGKYSKTYIDNLIIVNEETAEVNSRRAFLKMFPDHRKAIRRYIKDNSIRYRKANTQQLKKLMRYCGKIITG